MNVYVSSWSDLKLKPGMWATYSEDNKEYGPKKIDGSISYYTLLNKSDWDKTGTDTKDFYDTVKVSIDSNNCVLQKRSDDGIPYEYATPKPTNHTTYFTGAGDNGGVGNGNKLLFKMTAADVSKQVDLQFNEDIYLKDGFVITMDAPFGAYFNAELIHPVNGVIGVLAKKVFLFNSHQIPLNSNDSVLVPSGLKLRVTIFNSSGVGDEDPAANFSIVGRLELFRVNTV